MNEMVSDTELDRIFGARAKFVRLKHNFTAQQVAEWCGWPVEEVHALEAGRRNVQALTAIWLSRLYDITPHCFYTGLISSDGETVDNIMFVRLLKGSERCGRAVAHERYY